MSHGTNQRSHRTTVRVPDAVERLITAWIAWDANSASHAAVVEREAAVAALGLPGCVTHERIAAARAAGYDVPSAVQRTVLDLTREAS